MKRVLLLVEGQAEETFVRDVLGPHLLALGVHATPVLASTKRVKSGLKFKGGIQHYAKVRREIQNLLGHQSAAAVTTMLDFYGLPDDFPGLADLPSGASCHQRVEHLETALREDLRDRRFLPYLSLHEFEAILFVDPHELDGDFPGGQVGDRLAHLTDPPEEINDGPDTHPAARILAVAPAYRKTLHGPRAAARIGLAAIRRRCPHLNGWLTRLERLGKE